MKLYGNELDLELAKRRSEKEDRRSKRIGFREAAKAMGVKAIELLEYEYGYDICPHLEWEKSIGGIPPLFIFKQCKKCGKVDETSLKKITEEDIETENEF